MLTAENEVDGKELLDLGAFAYFNKPFKLEEIETAVERAIERRQELMSANQSKDTAASEESPDTDASA